MSRGPGIRQRAILEYLSEHLMADLRTIIAHYEGCDRFEIPDALLKSYQRAWRKLQAAEAISLVYYDRSEYGKERDDSWMVRFVWYETSRFALSENVRAAKIEYTRDELDHYRRNLRECERKNVGGNSLGRAQERVEWRAEELARLEAGDDFDEIERDSINRYDQALLKKLLG